MSRSRLHTNQAEPSAAIQKLSEGTSNNVREIQDLETQQTGNQAIQPCHKSMTLSLVLCACLASINPQSRVERLNNAPFRLLRFQPPMYFGFLLFT